MNEQPRQGRHHQEYAAPTELGNPSRTRFYKDAAPTALWLATRSYSDPGHEPRRLQPRRLAAVRDVAWLAAWSSRKRFAIIQTRLFPRLNLDFPAVDLFLMLFI